MKYRYTFDPNKTPGSVPTEELIRAILSVEKGNVVESSEPIEWIETTSLFKYWRKEVIEENDSNR